MADDARSGGRPRLLLRFGLAIGGIVILGFLAVRAGERAAERPGAEMAGVANLPSPEQPYTSPYTLELLAMSGERPDEGSSYGEVRGQVKNISTEPLRQVRVTVELQGKDGQFITSEDTYVDYDPIMPGQTSPFKVYVRWNPLITHFDVRFGTSLGAQIHHLDSRKAK